MNTVKTRIIKIGNSRGIRIPKLLIEQVGIGTEVEIAVEKNQLVVRSSSGTPPATPRLKQLKAQNKETTL